MSAPPVPSMTWDAPNLASTFQLFQQRLVLYFIVKDISAKNMVSHILLQVWEHGLQKHNAWTLTVAQKKVLDQVFNQFISELEPAANFYVSWLKNRHYKQEPVETLDSIISRFCWFAKKCDFSASEENERII